MTRCIIRTPADLVAAVPPILGFTPTNSIVIVGTGGGPTARVDISPDACDALSTAFPHWTGGVAVVIFSDAHNDLTDFAHQFLTTGVPTLVTVRADAEGCIFDSNDTQIGYVADQPPAELAAKRVVSSRAELEAEAADVHTADMARALMRESYLAGNGARAWVYLDRYVALNGTDEFSENMRYALENAVRPIPED